MFFAGASASMLYVISTGVAEWFKAVDLSCSHDNLYWSDPREFEPRRRYHLFRLFGQHLATVLFLSMFLLFICYKTHPN